MEHTLNDSGFLITPALFDPAYCGQLALHSAALRIDGAGSRQLLDAPWCRDAAARLRQHPALAPLMPADAVAVQCSYFEKSTGQNWLVPIHQDLGIPVRHRVEHAELSGWSEKEGQLFVQPPAALLEQLLAVRLHIDHCAQADGPLRVVPGSHRHGRLSPARALQLRADVGETSCPVVLGGALLLRPLLLHASSKASGNSQRRVLHFVFGPRALPYGLRWPPADIA